MGTLVLKRIVDTGFQEAVRRIPPALEDEGFAVLSVTDLRDMLKASPGVVLHEYRIFDVCDLSLAHEALAADLDLGATLPGHVVVRETGEGRAVVEALDPAGLVALHESPRIRELAASLRARLARALDAVGSRGSRAFRVSELMSRDLFSLPPSASAAEALRCILGFGITGAPVVNETGKPLGMVSLRDLASRDGPTVADRMTSPAAVMSAESSVDDAGRMLGSTGYRRLVVVDGQGRAVGMVSALDVVRGLLGLPLVHPAVFPRLDPRTGLMWSDDLPLEAGAVESVSTSPGLLVLLHRAPQIPERVVWAESAENLRARLHHIVLGPQGDEPLLTFWLRQGPLRFRTARLDDPVERRHLLVKLLHRARLPAHESPL